MNGNVRVPDPTLTQMNRELTERAQDKQAAVAMRAQDLQVVVNKAELAVRTVAALAAATTKVPDAAVLAGEKAGLYLANFFAKDDAPTDPLAGIPEEVIVSA